MKTSILEQFAADAINAPATVTGGCGKPCKTKSTKKTKTCESKSTKSCKTPKSKSTKNCR